MRKKKSNSGLRMLSTSRVGNSASGAKLVEGCRNDRKGDSGKRICLLRIWSTDKCAKVMSEKEGMM